MIQNYIFDIGNVLLRFHPGEIVQKVFQHMDPDTAHKFKTFLFDDGGWCDYDKGVLSTEDMIRRYIEIFPQCIEEIKIFFSGWPNDMQPIEPMINFMKKKKKEGKKIYALSNFPGKEFALIEQRYDFFKEFDGKVVSAYVKAIKPEHKIYKILLETYNLRPQESLFIDDMLPNVQAARELGIHAFHFTGFEEFVDQHNELLS